MEKNFLKSLNVDEEIDILANDFKVLNLDEENFKPIHNRLMKGKSEIRAYKPTYRILEFEKRIKPYVDYIRVCNIKLIELKDIRQKAEKHFREYSHNEIKSILTHLDNLIREQNEYKSIYNYDIGQIKNEVV